VLWTLNGSPIDVKPEHINPHTSLTAYDRGFCDLGRPKMKIRLVIFPGEAEVRTYMNDSSSRKGRFEKAHGGKDTRLFFTRRDWLADKGIYTREQAPPDMGFLSCNRNPQRGILFQSEFSTQREAQAIEDQKATWFYPSIFRGVNDIAPERDIMKYVEHHNKLVEYVRANALSEEDPYNWDILAKNSGALGKLLRPICTP